MDIVPPRLLCMFLFLLLPLVNRVPLTPFWVIEAEPTMWLGGKIPFPYPRTSEPVNMCITQATTITTANCRCFSHTDSITHFTLFLFSQSFVCLSRSLLLGTLWPRNTKKIVHTVVIGRVVMSLSQTKQNKTNQIKSNQTKPNKQTNKQTNHANMNEREQFLRYWRDKQNKAKKTPHAHAYVWWGPETKVNKGKEISNQVVCKRQRDNKMCVRQLFHALTTNAWWNKIPFFFCVFWN